MPVALLKSLVLAFFLVVNVVQAKGDSSVRMINATGRAAIVDDEDRKFARNRALEDALYHAALTGGAKIDGFTSVQADTRLDDHFIIRPSSQILDYTIVDEIYDDVHYEIIIQAAVGSIDKNGCQGRSLGHVSVFSPIFQLDRKIPPWTGSLANYMVSQIYDNLNADERLVTHNRMEEIFDPDKLNRDHRYNYKALTSRKALPIREGDFAFFTEVQLRKKTVKNSIQKKNFIEVVLISPIYLGQNNQNSGLVKTKKMIALGMTSFSKVLDALSQPHRSKIRGDFEKVARLHAESIIERLLCAPLQAVIKLKNDELYVNLGERQGLTANRLAIVDSGSTSWTMLKVDQVDSDGARLIPLNRQRSLAQLDGKEVTFLEFN